MAGPRLFWLTNAERTVSSPSGGMVLFPGEELTLHLTRSLRCRAGDRFLFCQPESGALYSGQVTDLSPLSIALSPVSDSKPALAPPKKSLFSLALAPLKGDFLAETIAQAVMCGIDRLIWLTTDRGVVRWSSPELLKKRERMEAIIREKSQLSGRTDRLEMDGPLPLRKLVDDPSRIFLFFDESDGGWGPGPPWWEVLPRQMLQLESPLELVAVIGPEGGWSGDERTVMRSVSPERFFRGTLGPRILSAESAILAVASLLGLSVGYARELDMTGSEPHTAFNSPEMEIS